MTEARHESGSATPPAPGDRPPPRWHALRPEAVLSALGTTHLGLTEAEAERRLARYGPNVLIAAPPDPAWRILVRQFRSVVVALLVVATALAWWTSDPLDAAAIAMVLVLNVLIGFVTELRARRAMEALVRLDAPGAVVVRAAKVRPIDARELVPGDVIELEAGQAVPADGRLLTVTELQSNEAALTGESTSVAKDATAKLTSDASLPDRITMVYKGTTVANGVARAVVVSTGMATEVGRIGALVRAIGHEPTPLERRMDSLGKQLAAVAIGIGVVVALVDLARGATLGVVLQMGIAVAIAAVPEGLPAVVTTTMAIAMRRMARRHALARRLPAVEALGSVTVICTDKTGTLTAGTQTVTAIWLPDVEVEVRHQDAPATFLASGRTLDVELEQRLERVLTIAALANRATLSRTDAHWEGHGDPTEVALLIAARQHGLVRVELLAERPEVGELPFSSARMLMATIHETAGGLAAYVKGAHHRVLARCSRVATAAGDTPLDAGWRHLVDERASAMAARGLRVLALADGAVADATDHAIKNLRFVGLVGITDPPAPGVVETIATLRGAGIRTVMLTGDHRDTALAIAREVGVAAEHDESLDGSAVDRLSDRDLETAARKLGVVSRVSPEGKLRVIAALQRRGDVVAMLGDGINDAAALKKADIGVAMGRRGSDAAKEVAGIVLEDDRFPTIAAAVEEGRVVADNIRKFVFYLFSCNLAEVAVLLIAGATGLPLPMTPIQVLWLNLVTDTFPALALAIEPGERTVLHQRPRDRRAPLLSRPTLWRGVAYSVAITAATLLALIVGLWRWPAAPARATTLSFTTLALAQIFHLGNARSAGPVTTLSRALANRYAVGAVVLTVLLQVLAVTAGPLRSVLGTAPLPLRAWLLAVALSVVPGVLGQSWKLARARRQRHGG